MTTIIVGACSADTHLEIVQHFTCRATNSTLRVAVPDSFNSILRVAVPDSFKAIQNREGSTYWIYHGQIADGRILASHRILQHLEFLTHDELLDRGLLYEEVLNASN